MEELNPQTQANQDVEIVKEELVAANPKLELNPKPVLNTESIDANIKDNQIKDQIETEKKISPVNESQTEKEKVGRFTKDKLNDDAFIAAAQKEFIEEQEAILADKSKREKVNEYIYESRRNFASKINRGLVNGLIQNVNNIYELGDDIVDLILGDLYDSTRTQDFELIPLNKPLDERSTLSNLIGGYTETEDDRNSLSYGTAKTITQYLIPIAKLGGFTKSIGIKRLNYGVAGAGVSALNDPYQENFFNWVGERSDVAKTIVDFLQAPKEYNEDGTLRPVEERMAARMRAMANDFIVGELAIGGTVSGITKNSKAIQQFAENTIKTSGLDKKAEQFGKVIFGIADYTKTSIGKKGNELVDLFMDKMYEMRAGNNKSRNSIVARLKNILSKDGGDIGDSVMDLQDQNLIENLNIYMEKLKTNPKLQKFYIGGDGSTLQGSPLKGSKITRTFNARDLNRYFKTTIKGKEKAFANKEAIVDFIVARGDAIRQSINPKSRTWKSMKAKARTQLPLDTINALSDFVETYGDGGEIDLEVAIIAMNDIVNESAIVVRELASKLDDMIAMKKGGSFDSKAYDVVKGDFAYTLKFLDSVLNIKRRAITPISRSLSLSNVTSDRVPQKGLKTILKLRSEDEAVELARKQAAKEMVDEEDFLGEFDIQQILDLADGGDTKALQQVVRKLHLAATNPKALKIILKHQKGSDVMKITNHLFINSILSNPVTHQVNLISTGINTFGKPIAKFAGAEDNATRLRALKDLQYLMSTSMESLKMAGFAFRANRNIVDAGQSILESKSAERIMMESWEGTKGQVGRAIMDTYGLPSRFLMAEDEFFKQMNFRSYLRATIWEDTQKAIEKGTKTFANRAEYNAYVNKEFNKIIKVINRESVQGKLSKKNLKLYRDAQKYAAESTFTEDLADGHYLKQFQNAVNEYPLARQIVPFIRTPINIMKQFGKASPIAALGDTPLGKKLRISEIGFVKEHLAEVASKDKSVRAIAIGRTRLGGAAWAGGITAAFSINDPEAGVAITGGLPKNKEQREMMLATGFQPYSFRFLATEEEIAKYGKVDPLNTKGSRRSRNPLDYILQKGENSEVTYVRGADGKVKYKYVSYKRLEPWASYLALSADFARIAPYLTEAEKLEKESMYQVMQAAMYDNLVDKTFLSGIAELIPLFEDPSRMNAFITRRIAQIAVPFSGTGKFIKGAINSGAFGQNRDGNIRVDKKITKGQFQGDYNPMIFATRLVNEIASLTPHGDRFARPVQNHITGKFVEIPVGFGKDEWNPLLDGWTYSTVSNNDPVLSVLQETGGEFAAPNDLLLSDDNFDNELRLNSEELADLIYNTAKFRKGTLKLRMYDAMDRYIKENDILVQLMRGNALKMDLNEMDINIKAVIANVEGKDINELTKDDFSNSDRINHMYRARKILKDGLQEIHNDYKTSAKEWWIKNSKVLDQEKRDKFFRDEDRNNKIFQGIVEVSSNSLLEQFAAKSLIS